MSVARALPSGDNRRSVFAGVPALLNGLAHADNTLLVNGIKARLQELDSLAWGMNAAIQCQEEFLLSSPDDQAAVMAAVRPGYEGMALRFPESSSALPIWCAKGGISGAVDPPGPTCTLKAGGLARSR